MLFPNFTNHAILLLLIIFLSNCNLKEVNNSHGVGFLVEKTKKININQSNQNDIINIFGPPSTTDFFNKERWIYIERSMTKGKVLNLGKNIIKENNTLLIDFDENGLVTKYEIIDKNKMKKVKFSKDETQTITSNQDFIYSFLSSLRRKINDPTKKKLKKK